MDMQKQLADQNIDAVSTTREIGDIYDCLDILDDRLLDLVKSEKTQKTKKQVRKEKKENEAQEIEALDKKDPTEELFDQFIADSLTSDPEGVIGFSDLQKIFKDWYAYYHGDDDQMDRPSNHKLKAYMCRNFNWNGHFWIGIRDQAEIN